MRDRLVPVSLGSVEKLGVPAAKATSAQGRAWASKGDCSQHPQLLDAPLLDQIDCPLAAVIADGAYDGEPVSQAISRHSPEAAVIIPPRSTVVPGDRVETALTQRDRHNLMIRERGRLGWQKAVGYGRRSLGEVAMLRYQLVIGRSLRAGTLPAQQVEASVGCKVLNIMTNLGMPASCKVT
jgi:hypothetical protein